MRTMKNQKPTTPALAPDQMRLLLLELQALIKATKRADPSMREEMKRRELARK
jgi:hypothetical protein